MMRGERLLLSIAFVILSEAKNLGSNSEMIHNRNGPEMFESLASCFAFRCSASLNMTALLVHP